MTNEQDEDQRTCVLLLKAGRLPSWYRLSTEEQASFSKEHVNLMLSISRRHELLRMEGYRLMFPVGDWERFWVIEFPDQNGVEAWIEAEMAPLYGTYGFYEYHFARQVPGGQVSSDRTAVNPGVEKRGWPDPQQVPLLETDKKSMVLLTFSMEIPGGSNDSRIDSDQLTDEGHSGAQQDACGTVTEFADSSAVESFAQLETSAGQRKQYKKSMHLARRWAPEYFTSWVPDRRNRP